MKRLVVGFLTGVLLSTASVGVARSNRTIQLRPGDRAEFAGMRCSAKVDQVESYLSCVSTGRYDVDYGTKRVLVYRFVNGKSRIVFNARQ